MQEAPENSDPPKRGRGRPVGSRNRRTLEREAVEREAVEREASEEPEQNA